ncbi:hypothetical protein PA25_39440 [Pseudoalteromonas sp. A25]|uniref:hypothetical protein n=1 Tax=Pseudoalteromonas sp. A25 TaxID=116092 RepID=UPI001260808C|nr:hypothetical protein [Pseudoalteromonas sp. A25]BBN83959.1 hypothetical protein PA25_39440 [Pseudoalteromonas sp. A25]
MTYKRVKPKRTSTDLRGQAFIHAALEELRQNPKKLSIVKQNCLAFKQQPFLKRGLLVAVERFEWVFEVDDDIERVIAQVLAEDYIGNRIRRYPLLFKGVVND